VQTGCCVSFLLVTDQFSNHIAGASNKLFWLQDMNGFVFCSHNLSYAEDLDHLKRVFEHHWINVEETIDATMRDTKHYANWARFEAFIKLGIVGRLKRI
jgi:hypothetical protein